MADAQRQEEAPRLAPFNPTDAESIQCALELLQLTADDVLVDLGCGDGRVLVAAVEKTGCRGIGVELDEELAARARERAAAAGGDVQVRCGDASRMDLSEATAVFCYLVPAGLCVVAPALHAARRRGARIVTHMFRLPGERAEDPKPEPTAVRQATAKSKFVKAHLYMPVSAAGEEQPPGLSVAD